MIDAKNVIVIIHNTLPGGVQRVGIMETAWLNKVDFNAALVSILKSKEWDLVKKLNVRTIYLYRNNELLGRLIGTLLINKLASKPKYIHPAIVIAHNIPGGQVALHLKKLSKDIKLILYLHDPLAYPISGSLYSICAKLSPYTLLKIEREIVQHADVVLTNSKRTLVKLIKIHGEEIDLRDKAIVLYPTVNTPLLEHGIKKEKMRYLLIVGRIDHEAFLNLYRIMKRIDIPLIIAGSCNPYNVKSRKIISLFYALRNRGKKIKILFNPSDEEILNLYRNALLFVYPGHENFNMSAIEAMSSGCPTLVADSSGVCEIMPKNLREYLCIPKDNISLWIERILEIIRNDESYRLGKECWRITLRYNVHTHMSKLIKIIRGLYS